MLTIVSTVQIWVLVYQEAQGVRHLSNVTAGEGYAPDYYLLVTERIGIQLYIEYTFIHIILCCCTLPSPQFYLLHVPLPATILGAAVLTITIEL
jgi:hypothetical protein